MGKFNATKVTLDGIRFDSKLESQVFLVLKNIHDDGGIKNLKVHQGYLLHGVDGKQVCKYEVDFIIELCDDSLWAIEVKGIMTAVASLKVKLFRAEYPIPLWVCRSKNLDSLVEAGIDVRSSPKAKRPTVFKSWLKNINKVK